MADQKQFQAQLSFNAGYASPFFTPRVDMEKYGSALSACDNFIPRNYGSLRRRPGTKGIHVFDHPFRILRFPTASDKEFLVCLMAGDNLNDDDPFARVVDATDEGYPIVADLGVVDNSYDAYPTHTPYLEAELKVLDHAKQNDVMFLTHGNHCPMQITHYYNDDGADAFKWDRFLPEYFPKSNVTYSSFNGEFTYWRRNNEANSNIWFIAAPDGYTGEIKFDRSDLKSPYYLNIRKTASEAISDQASSNEPNYVWDFPENNGSWSSTTDGNWLGEYSIWERYPFVINPSNRFETNDNSWNRLYSTDTAPKGKQRNFTYAGTSYNRSYVTTRHTGDQTGYYNYVTSNSQSMLDEPFWLRAFDSDNLGHPSFAAHLWMPDIQNNKWIYKTPDYKVVVESIVPAAWGNKLGWPGCCTFRSGRLWFASTRHQPQTIWASEVDNYGNFLPGSDADSPIDVTLGSDRSQKIQWLNSGRTMVIGTDVGEWVLTESTGTTPVPSVAQQSEYGSTTLKSETIGESVLYVTRDGIGLQTAIYDFGIDGYSSENMTIIAGDVAEGGFTANTSQRNQDMIWWAATKKGNLVGLLFNRQQGIAGWHRHSLDGGQVIDLVSFKDLSKNQESLALCVKRGEKFYLEVMDDDFDCLDLQVERVLDEPSSSLVLTGSLSDAGDAACLARAFSETGVSVAGYADGIECPVSIVVSDGAFTLTVAAAQPSKSFKAGIPFESRFTSMPMGSFSSYVAPATITSIIGFNYELLWEGTEDDKSPISGWFAAISFDREEGYAANSPKIEPCTFNNGRGNMKTDSHSSRDVRLSVWFNDYKKVNVLSTYILYSSNVNVK